jgi:hypothetical protein
MVPSSAAIGAGVPSRGRPELDEQGRAVAGADRSGGGTGGVNSGATRGSVKPGAMGTGGGGGHLVSDVPPTGGGVGGRDDGTRGTGGRGGLNSWSVLVTSAMAAA